MKTPFMSGIVASVLFSAQALWGASGLSLNSSGVVIDNGADAALTLVFPVLVDAARKDIKVQKATTDATSAVLSYEGGGRVTVTLAADEIILTTTDLPAGTSHLHAKLRLGPEYGGVGQWKIGDARQTFPKDKPASPFLHKGGGADFELTGLTGMKTAIHASAFCYQQLNDNREWHGDFFEWHVWIPLTPEASSSTLRITFEAGGATVPMAPPPAPKAPALSRAGLPALQAVSDSRVLKWKDGKRAVFMIDFDDSASSHIKNVIPELKRRGIPGTFYINPGNGPYKNFQSAWEKEAGSPGIELANHTFTHIGGLTVDAFEQEIVKCNEVLNQLYPSRKQPRLISFGRPGVPKNQWGITEAEIQQVLAKHHMIERPQFVGPPFAVKTIPEMTQYIDEAIAGGEMKSLVFHGVGGDWLITPLDYFTALLDKLEAECAQLWLTDPLSWHQYTTERKTASVKVLQSNATLIRLEVTSQADPAFYDLPLSLDTKVPASWKKCVVSQGAAKVEVPVVDGEVRYDATPGAGPVSLTVSL